MLAHSMVSEIRRLLATGNFSQRKIARMTGISRGTIGAIASGRRPDYENRPSDEDDYEQPVGPPQRCPLCGAMVYMPCRACGLQQRLAEKSDRPRPTAVSARRLPSGGSPTSKTNGRKSDKKGKQIRTAAASGMCSSIELELRPEHRHRYEKVRKRRIRAEHAGFFITNE